MLQIEALPAFTDNYIWLIKVLDQQRCAVVDPGDAKPVLAWLEAHPDWQLTDILVTHHHPDHVGGVLAVKQATGAIVYGPTDETIPGRDHALRQDQRIEVLGLSLDVLDVPGHTRGHIAYFHDDDAQPWLLSGDTLFAGGCGRLFEGTPRQMHSSLQKLAALPPATQIYCAHEYTQSNLRFALAVEPGNQTLAERAEQVSRLRDAGAITLPSTLALELATNPFLRVAQPEVQAAAARHSGVPLTCPAEVFAALREWKDRF